MILPPEQKINMNQIDVNVEVHKPSYHAGWQDCKEYLTEEQDKLAEAIRSWLQRMDSQGYTDKQYKKGELRAALKEYETKESK